MTKGIQPNHERRARIFELRQQGLTLKAIGEELEPPVSAEAVRLQLLLIAKQGLESCPKVCDDSEEGGAEQ
jgi:hypothetical protein